MTRTARKACTLSVPTFGQVALGLGRNASYQAAARGDFPTIKIGQRLRVPVAAAEQKFGIDLTGIFDADDEAGRDQGRAA